jgi:hypothetical protein
MKSEHLKKGDCGKIISTDTFDDFIDLRSGELAVIEDLNNYTFFVCCHNHRKQWIPKDSIVPASEEEVLQYIMEQ